jgi:hypothetical protein
MRSVSDGSTRSVYSSKGHFSPGLTIRQQCLEINTFFGGGRSRQRKNRELV